MHVGEDRGQDLAWVLEKLSAAKKPAARGISTPKPAQSVEQKKQELKSKQPQEVKLWEAYRDSGWHPTKLDPLLKSFAGLINSRINIYKNRVEVPTSFIEQVHKIEFAKALKDYDPKRAALNTHLTRRLKKAGRPIETYKNFAYIPENVSKNIGAFNAFKAELTEKLGYEPDDHAIHDHALKSNHPKLGALSLKDIKRLNTDQRKGLIQTGHEQDLLRPEMDPRELEVAHLIVHQLTPQERLVHEYTLGLNGKPQLAPGAIAKKLKMDNSKVAKLRTTVWNKMAPYLETT
jgi:DNA-directed RNA polymerase specialized sigma subunit